MKKKRGREKRKKDGFLLEKDKRKISHLVNKEVDLEKKIEDVEAQLWTIQRSTRTEIPQFIKIHNHLRSRYQWYYKWHILPWASKVHLVALIFVMFLTTFTFAILFSEPQVAQAANFTWDGGGTDGDCGGAGTGNNWSCGKNWVGDGAPGGGDIAIFNNTSTKDVTVDANVTITGLTINITYTGDIDLNGKTIDTSTLTNSGGTVIDSVGGGLVKASGTVSSGGGTWTGGTLELDSTGNQSWTGGSTAWNNVIVNLTGAISDDLSIITNWPHVSGNFTHTDGQIAGGYIYIGGDLTVGANANGSTTVLYLDGNGPQELNNLGGYTSRVTIDKPSGTATLKSGSSDFRIQGGNIFTMTSGTLDLNGETIVTGTTGDLQVSGGIIDLNGGLFDVGELVMNGGIVQDTAGGGKVTAYGPVSSNSGTWTGGTLEFDATTNATWYGGSTAWNDVIVNLTDGVNDDLSIVTSWPNVTGDFIHTDGQIFGGYIYIGGDLTVGANANGGGSILTLDGNGPQELNNLGGYTSQVTINKSSGTATLKSGSSDFRIQGGNTFTMTSGTLDLNGETIVTGTTGDLQVSGGIIDLNGGLFDVGELVMAVGIGGIVQDTAGGGKVTAYGPVSSNSGTWTGGTLEFDATTNATWYGGSTAWNDVIVNLTDGVNNNLSIMTNWPHVSGDFTHTDGAINGGYIYIGGDLTVGVNANGGTTNIYLDGGGTQLITQNGGTCVGTIKVDKSSGIAQMETNLTIPTRLDILSGILYTNGHNLAVTANTFNNDGTLRVQGGETLTFTRDTNTGLVEYVGDGGATTYNSLNYGNTHWNAKFDSTSGNNTWQLGANQTVVNDLTVSAGTFDVNNYTIAISGNTLINGGTMMTGTNTNTFGNAGTDTVTISSGELQIESDNTLADIVKTANTWTNSGGTIRYNAAPVVSTTLLTALSPYYNLIVDSANSTYTLGGAIEVNGDFEITTNSIVDTSNGDNFPITLAGDWTNAGTFTPRLGTVTFDGGDGTTQIISGDTTFNNFSASTAANTTGRTLQFEGGSTQTISDTLTLGGASGKRITLESSDLNAWTINPTAANVTYVDVSRSTNAGVNFCATYSVDSGSNTDWDISPVDYCPGPTDQSNSYITVSPVELPTKNSATITIYLRDATNLAIPGNTITITSSNPQVQITYVNQVSDLEGKVIAYITSNSALTTTLTITDTTDGVTFAAHPQITWTKVSRGDLEAKIIAPDKAIVDTEVTLDGRGSIGNISRYQWDISDPYYDEEEGIVIIDDPINIQNSVTFTIRDGEVVTYAGEKVPDASITGTIPPEEEKAAQEAVITDQKIEESIIYQTKEAVVNAYDTVTGFITDTATKAYGYIKNSILNLYDKTKAFITKAVAKEVLSGDLTYHTFSKVGYYNLKLTVFSGNKRDSATHQILIVPPPPVINSIEKSGEEVLFIGTAYPDSDVYLFFNPTISTAAFAKIHSDSEGNWSYTQPKSTFTQGDYSVYGITVGEQYITSDPSERYLFQITFEGGGKDKSRGILDIFGKTTLVILDIISKVLYAITLIAAAISFMPESNFTHVVTLGLFNAYAYLHYLLMVVLERFGLLRKRRPWGVVYDSISKTPVPLAIVRIFDQKTKKLLETRVTDKEGRFGFLVSSGTYKIKITKYGYKFASTVVKEGRKIDDIYSNLYHGASFAVTPKEKFIDFNIPIDPIIEKEEKAKQNILSQIKSGFIITRTFVKKVIIPLLSFTLMSALFMYLVSGETLHIYMIVILALLLLKEIISRRRQLNWGIVYNSQTKRPVKGALVKIFDHEYNRLKETKITDAEGRFGFLVPKGKYHIEVEKEGFSFPSTIISHKNDDGHFHNIYQKDVIEKAQNDMIISVNIPIDPH